jgi:pyruvate carboxylase subunit B
MPEYNILIGNQNYKVSLIKKNESSFQAKINEKPFELKLTQNKLKTSSLFTIVVAGQKYNVKTESVKRRTPFKLSVNNIQFTVQLSEPKRKPATSKPNLQMPAIKHQKLEEGAVVAPMAGKIIKIKIKEGDDVKAGDAICTLEAMKMENEISATKTGKVREIRVSEGSPVNERDTIAIIK